MDLTRAAPLEEGNESSASSTTAIVLSVVFLTLAMVVLIVIYYKRRLKRMQKDLQNRSVYYVENSILDPARHHANQHDLVVTDHEPIEETETDPTLILAKQLKNNMQNNAAAGAPVARAEKNVNIDRFKLHDADEPVQQPQQQQLNQCEAAEPLDGACAVASEADQKEYDINVFDEKCSPSKEKNNFLLDHSRKINKASVDLVFNNLSTTESSNADKEGLEDEDDIAIAKMTSYLEQPKK